MSTLDIYAAGFPHGSAAGFEGGCKTAPLCEYSVDSEYFTCKEAAFERRTNFAYRNLPIDTPLRRDGVVPDVPVKKARAPKVALDLPDLTSDIPPAGHDKLTDPQRRSHYAKGCRDDYCRSAFAAYKRAAYAAKKGAPTVPRPRAEENHPPMRTARRDATREDRWRIYYVEATGAWCAEPIGLEVWASVALRMKRIAFKTWPEALSYALRRIYAK